MQTLVLASTSPFRQQILKKFGLPFQTCKPHTDETPLANESAADLVARLSQLKAKAGALQFKQALVIGSDQVALCNGEILSKPHTVDNAIAQLTKLNGNKVAFLTGLSVVNSDTNEIKTSVETFYVHFKQSTQAEIKAYVMAEMPLNCAGSFKSEALGISLFKKLEGDDPNTLIGLPMIKLTEMLNEFGFNPLLELAKQK